MMNPKQWLLASNNDGKRKEFAALLEPIGISLISQGELAIPEAPEPYLTFLENALAKARHAARLSGLPSLADDSGLCVDALGGAPGVHSARYAGEPKSDSRNNALLLERMAGIADRRAAFVCTLVLVRHAEDPDPIVAQGRWPGNIVQQPSGSGGFGYDPLFWINELSCTSADLSSQQKNSLSHRAQAMRRLIELCKS
jgi:XTP/dITP diphosphohydrolase